MPTPIMQCEGAAEMMPLYLSGELEASLREPLERHLDSCAPCRRRLDADRVLDDQLRCAVLAEEIDVGPAMERFRLHKPETRWAIRRWAVAAAVLGAVAGGLTYWRFAGQPAGPDVYQAALRDHHRELIERQPRPWSDDAAGVFKLAVEQGVAANLIERLAPAGYRLEHGKVCRLNGRAYLHLVYENQGEEVSVFLRSGERPPAEGRFHSASSGSNEHLAGVDADQLSVFYVTDDAAEAERLAAQAAAVL